MKLRNYKHLAAAYAWVREGTWSKTLEKPTPCIASMGLSVHRKSNVAHNAGRLGFHSCSDANACETDIIVFYLICCTLVEASLPLAICHSWHCWGRFVVQACAVRICTPVLSISKMLLLSQISETSESAQCGILPDARHQQELWQSRPELIAARAEAWDPWDPVPDQVTALRKRPWSGTRCALSWDRWGAAWTLWQLYALLKLFVCTIGILIEYIYIL